jgi:hypothetical protein
LIVLIAFLAGAAFGWRRAGRRGGNRLDRWHYAAAHAIAFALAALFATVLVQLLSGG